MDFNKEIEALLAEDIYSVDKYIEVIKEIKNKMKKSLRNNVISENMTSFYRGDKETAELCPKLFLDTSCFKVENITFIDRYKNRNDKNETELHFLCNIQHQGRCTRLLDFSTDPLVALRFACGRDEKCDKRITVFYTDSIKKEEKDFEDEDIKALMKLVMSEDLKNFTEDEKVRISKDYFIELPSFLDDVERCKRQKGAFLFPGNLERIDRDYHENEKVIHKLSETTGRGESYPGYIVNVRIKKEYVKDIRDELEKTEKYKIDYLMCEKQNQE